MKKAKSEDLEYKVVLFWDKKSGGKACLRDFPPLQFDMPVEFGGESRFPCPDEFFFSAVGGCLVTTFLYFRKRLELNLKGLQVSVQGRIGLVGPEGYRIKGIRTLMKVKVDAKEKSKAEKCAQLAKEYCHVTRSLEHGVPVEASYEIRISDRDENRR